MVTSQNFVSVAIADSCLFTGFHILVYYNTDWGVGISGAGSIGNSLITLNNITTGFEGIFVGGSPVIYKNNFSNLKAGVELFSSKAIVRKNFISTANIPEARGIYIHATSNNYNPVIDSNYIEISSPLSWGIEQSFGANPTIKNNTIKLKHVGAMGIQGGASIPDSVNNFQ